MLDLVFFSAEPLFQKLDARIEGVSRRDKLFEWLDILIQELSIVVVLTAANQEHVFDGFYFPVGELARGAPR